MDRTIHKIFPGNEAIIPGRFPIFPGVESIILRQFPLKIAIKFQAPLIPSPVKGHSSEGQSEAFFRTRYWLLAHDGPGALLLRSSQLHADIQAREL